MEIIFVLVEPAVHENIGAAARALKTMGFSSLRLVNPANHLDERARWVAHASNDILENAAVFATLPDAIHDADITIAATARQRTIKRDCISSKKLKEFLSEKNQSAFKAAVIFGREDSGLTNDELAQCDLLTYVDLSVKYPSLNLAQAVMIYAYELSRISDGSTIQESGKSNLSALKDKTRRLLDSIDVTGDSNLRMRVFEHIAQLNDKQIRIMQSLFDRILDKIKR